MRTYNFSDWVSNTERFPLGSSVYTGVGPRAVSPFVEAPFCGTGSLIYRYWPISAPYFCGSRRRISEWAISAGARCGGVEGLWRFKQHHTISTNRSTAEPVDEICAGAPCVFLSWCKCPFTMAGHLRGNPQVEAQLDCGPGSEIRVGWKIGVMWSRKRSCKMAMTELWYLLTKLYHFGLVYDMINQFHGGKEL